jgi:SAM-dependent methyltransferase
MTSSTTDATFARTAKEIARDLITRSGLGRLHVAMRKLSGQNVEHLSLPSLPERFAAIYQKRVWLNGRPAGSLSGYGSELETTTELRRNLAELLSVLETRSLLDLGCGDFTWIQEVAFPHSYIGIDVVAEVIEANNAVFGSSKRRFALLDATNESLPRVDTILCREVLFHLSLRDIRRVIENIRASRSTYLIATSDGDTDYNADILSGDFRLLNLRKSPFLFGEPLRSIPDSGVSAFRTLSVWTIANLPPLSTGRAAAAGKP